MAISREKKQQVVAEVKEMLTRSNAVIISDYRGLTAGQMAELRNRLPSVEDLIQAGREHYQQGNLKAALEE